MANPMGGYSAPNYGNYGYNGNYNFNPNMYNNSMSPYAQQLRNLEMQNPQYGQTMPPANNQPMQQPMQQVIPQPQTQQNNMFTPVAIVAGAQEASSQIPDMVNGTKSIYYDTSTDQFYMNYFDFDTGKKVFRIYPNSEPQGEIKAEQTDSKEPAETEAMKYVTNDDVQPIRCQISSIEEELKQLRSYVTDMEKELFVDESYGNNSNDGAAKSTGAANASNGAGNARAKSERRSNDTASTKSIPAATGKSNAGEPKGKDSAAD